MEKQISVPVANGITWVGVQDPGLRRFDVVMKTQYGSSYNSYIVKGEKKTALIDTVKDGFFAGSLERIKSVVDPAKIDVIVIQHTEPDHSGSISELLKAAPNAKIYCTRAAAANLPQIANEPVACEIVKDGEVLDLGGHTLRFILAPNLHWPDTMFTYDEKAAALFTCDAFGSHFSAPEILMSKTDYDMVSQARYYYDCIMSPFAPFVQKAVAAVKSLKIDLILPSHGPVLDKDPMKVVELYQQWAGERAHGTEKRAFIGYVSCYGYTKALADALGESLKKRGFVVVSEDISLIDPADFAERVYRSDAVAIGSPTVVADALPPVWNALAHVLVPLVRGKAAAAFGSYGWSGEAVASVEQRLTALGFKVVGTMRTKFRPDAAALAEAAALGDALADSVKR